MFLQNYYSIIKLDFSGGKQMLKIMGQAAATVEQMQSYIKMVNPKVSDSVIKMIPLYISEGAIEGVRGDVAFAQVQSCPGR